MSDLWFCEFVSRIFPVASFIVEPGVLIPVHDGLDIGYDSHKFHLIQLLFLTLWLRGKGTYLVVNRQKCFASGLSFKCSTHHQGYPIFGRQHENNFVSTLHDYLVNGQCDACRPYSTSSD